MKSSVAKLLTGFGESCIIAVGWSAYAIPYLLLVVCSLKTAVEPFCSNALALTPYP